MRTTIRLMGAGLLAAGVAAGVTAQTYPAAGIPAALRTDVYAVVRLDAQEYDIQARNRYQLRRTYALTVLDREGAEHARVYQSYDSYQKVTRFEVTVYDAEGKKIRKLKPTEIGDISASAFSSAYNEVRYKAARVAETSYPYTLVAEIELSSNGLYGLPEWEPQPAPQVAVQEARMQVRVAPGLNLLHQGLRGMPAPVETPADGGKTYTWQVNGLVGAEPEPFSPHPSDVQMRLLLAPSEFELYGYPGSYSSWQAYGRWINDTYADRTAISDSEAEQVRQLTAGLRTDEDKIAAVYRYMQSRMRYVAVYFGLGGLQPHAATETSAKGYGDCKDLSTYVRAMLQAAGVKAYPVLIQRGWVEPEVSATFASHQFNHMILAVPQPQDTLWLECTSTDAPPGYLGPDDEARRVVVVTETGGQVAHTPVYPSAANTTTWRLQAELDAEGNLSGKLLTRHRGHDAMLVRSLATELKSDEQREYFVRSFRNNLLLNNLDMQSAARKAAEPVLAAQVSAQRYAARAGTRLLVKPHVLARKMPVLPETAERKTDLVFHFPLLYRMEHTDSVVIRVPEGLVLDNQFAPVHIETDFAQYDATLAFDHERRELHYVRVFRFRAQRLPAKRYEDVRQFFSKMQQADNTQVVLTKGT